MKKTCEVEECRHYNPVAKGCSKGLLREENQTNLKCDSFKSDLQESTESIEE